MDQYFQLAHSYQSTGIFPHPLLDSSMHMANLSHLLDISFHFESSQTYSGHAIDYYCLCFMVLWLHGR